MTELVVDASTLLFALTGRTPAADRLRRRLDEAVCHAPHLIDAELGHVLRRRVLVGALTAEEAVRVMRTAAVVIDQRYPHAGALSESAWRWRENVSFYDALYVALATELRLTLLTGDATLSRAPGLTCPVEVVRVPT